MINESRRKAGRRKRRRRTYDALQGRATKEERLQYDRMLWSIWLDKDRRTQERRSGSDRRGCGLGAGVTGELTKAVSWINLK